MDQPLLSHHCNQWTDDCDGGRCAGFHLSRKRHRHSRSYIVVAITYIVFAAGFTAMSQYVSNSGAFYAYVGRGLGATPGIGAAAMAIFAYNGMLSPVMP